MSLLKFITSFPLFKEGEVSLNQRLLMSYMGRSELIAAVKKNKTTLKPHPFLVINKEHDLNYFSLLCTCFK